MKISTLNSSNAVQDNTRQSRWRHPLDRFARNLVHSRLSGICNGEITFIDDCLTQRYGTPDSNCALRGTVHIRDARFYSEIAFGGSVGAGEAYMQGWWDADDLTVVMRILLQNRYVLDGMESGFARLAAPLRTALHWMSRNTRRGSRRNIQAHYDLGNAFFPLFLDPSMMYSSAIFEHPGMTLEQASVAKLDRICRKLELKPDDHVIEIGTGWGGFALHAAKNYGCRVTTTTISREQYELANARIHAAGLEDRITLLQQDYRDLTGCYDKLVSIEMIEAVGHHYFDAYFSACSRLLKPDGMMLLQAITIADQQYQSARTSVDFIKQRIFPGCCIPSVSVLCDAVARVTDMRLFQLNDIGPHYATTLKHWRERFFANIASVRTLGYPESFIRMWEFYLCYCEAGFAEHATGDVQMLLIKPDARPSLAL